MFTDRLKINVALTIGNDAVAITGGAVTHLALDMTVYGFEGRLSFVVSSEQTADPVFAGFTSSALIGVSLTIERLLDDGSSDENAETFAVVGYVTERSMTEVVAPGLLGAPIIDRVYTVRFFDVARAFWSEHHPIELHAGSALGAVLALHSVSGMTLNYDWTRLGETQDILCIGLEAERGTSFYDFVAWYVNRFDGVIELDPTSGTYRLGGSKSTPATSVELELDDVATVSVRLAEPPRHSVNALNGYSDAAVKTAAIVNTNGVTGVRQDVLERTPLSATFDRRVALETGRLTAGQHELDIVFKAFPEQLPVPNGGVTFEDQFSAALLPSAGAYRAIGVHLVANANCKLEDIATDDISQSMTIELSLRAELQASRTRHLPSFRSPQWPVIVEGVVQSASGQPTDRTWFTAANATNSIFQYQVLVPLWNETIVVPFSPEATGHFFFPAYQTQRVLLAIGFDSAEIIGCLDWADTAKLSLDSQGNAVAFGTSTTNGTLIRHQYEDGMPALHIQRTLGGDTQTIDVAEGIVRIVVKDDPTVPPVVPTFDVTPQVESSKAEIASGVSGAVTTVTGNFETSTGAVQTSLDTATGEVGTAVTTAAATLSGQIDDVQGQLQGIGASAADAVSQITSKVADAKAALQAVLTGGGANSSGGGGTGGSP